MDAYYFSRRRSSIGFCEGVIDGARVDILQLDDLGDGLLALGFGSLVKGGNTDIGGNGLRRCEGEHGSFALLYSVINTRPLFLHAVSVLSRPLVRLYNGIRCQLLHKLRDAFAAILVYGSGHQLLAIIEGPVWAVLVGLIGEGAGGGHTFGL